MNGEPIPAGVGYETTQCHPVSVAVRATRETCGLNPWKTSGLQRWKIGSRRRCVALCVERHDATRRPGDFYAPGLGAGIFEVLWFERKLSTTTTLNRRSGGFHHHLSS